jgi:hypothetical protein
MVAARSYHVQVNTRHVAVENSSIATNVAGKVTFFNKVDYLRYLQKTLPEPEIGL